MLILMMTVRILIVKNNVHSEALRKNNFNLNKMQSKGKNRQRQMNRQRDNDRDREWRKSKGGEEALKRLMGGTETHWSSRGPACGLRAAWCGSSYSMLVC